MAAQVLRAAGAAAVAVETGQRLGAARLERAAQHVALLRGVGLHGASSSVGRARAPPGTGWHRAHVSDDAPAVLWRPTPESARATRAAAFAAWVPRPARHRLRRPARLRRPVALVGRAPRPVLGRRRGAGPACCPASPTTACSPDRSMPGAEWFPGTQRELRRAGAALGGGRDRRPGAGRPGRDHDDRRRGAGRDLVGAAARPGRAPSPRRCAGWACSAATGWPATCPTCPRRSSPSSGAASIGAVWAACAPDFGTRAVLDRFAQIEPTVLVAVDGYRFNGREHDRRDVVAELRAALPTVRATISVPRLHPGELPDGALRWADAVAEEQEPQFEQLPVRPPAVDRLLLGDDRPAQGDRARARRHGAGGPQVRGAAHRRRPRRPAALVRLDGLDHVELRRGLPAVGRDGGASTTARRPSRPSTSSSPSPPAPGSPTWAPAPAT